MNDHDQLEFLTPAPPKIFKGGNGIELPYWLKHSGGADARMPDGQLVSITKQGTGPAGNCRYYAVLSGPDGKPQKVQSRHFKSVLAQLALIAQAITLAKATEKLATSIQFKAKQQQDLLRIAQDLTNADASELEKENSRIIAELESERAENARLRDQVTTLNRQTARAPEKPEKFKSKVLIIEPDLIETVKLQNKEVTKAAARWIALILRQLAYLLREEFGKILSDGRRYIYGTYYELHAQYFSSLCSVVTVKRGFLAAERLRLVDSRQPERNVSRRKYYTLSSEGIKLIRSAKMPDKTIHSTAQNDLIREEVKKDRSFSTKGKNPADVGVGPKPNGSKLYELAATATDQLDLIEKLKPHFPQHDVAKVFRRFVQHRKDNGLRITAARFVAWMLDEEPPLRKAKRSPDRFS